MAKKNKNKPSKNGTKAAARDATAPKPSRSSIYAAAAIAALAAVAAVALNGRDPDTATANAVLVCYATSDACDTPLPSCGVVTAPSQIASALRANDAVLVAAVSGITTTLVRAAGETPLASGTNASALDRALLALDIECGTKLATTTSPRLKQVLAVFKEVSGTQAREPVNEARITQLRKLLKDADVDTRGALGVGGFFASAASIATADTPLLRTARNCDPRATMALLQLGANPRLRDARNLRALDLALKCQDRNVFGVAKLLIDHCGRACVDFESDTTPHDGLNPLHRVMLLWASSWFPTRPAQNPCDAGVLCTLSTPSSGGPSSASKRDASMACWWGRSRVDGAGANTKTHRWNMMLAWMLEAGADATQPTRTPSSEAPLHIACAKRNVRALELLLDSLSRTQDLQEALRQKDALGGFAPLHVCGGSWKIWSVTLPRLLAGAGELNTQALDLDEACVPLVRSLATDDGHPALATADVLAQCGFYGRGVALLIQNGAPVDARDAQNRTFLHFLHPHLVADMESSLPSMDVPYKDVISGAVAKHPDASQLLAESRLERERWHAPKPEPAPHTTFDASDLNCDEIVAVAQSDDEVRDAIRDHRPVLRRDALDASWDKAREDWGDRNRLEQLGGGALVRSGPIPYASAFATTERVLTLREAMARSADESAIAETQRKKKNSVEAPSYVFEQIRWDGVSTDHPLFDVIKARVGDSPVSEMIIHDAQFFVGSKYSGAPAHYHSHAMNFLVRGKKRWLLWPPASALYSRVPAVSWLDRKDARAYQCVQPENASLYVPAGWGHAVLNLEDHTVGVALEFHVEGELAWSFESRATDLVSASRRL